MGTILKALNSIFWLGLGVLLLIVLTSSFMALLIIPTYLVLMFKSDSKPAIVIKNIWLAFDCMWNAILLGHPKETFSSRLGKIEWHHAPTRMPKWFTYRLMRLLNVIDHKHCFNSIDWRYGWKKLS